jgi:phosphoribosylaminoimidazolecarboxamide formyltransferase/IMP cyclohydrolase
MSINTVNAVSDAIGVEHVLVSVSDKGGLEDFIPGIVAISENVRFYSTGQTHARIKEILADGASGRLVAVSDFTGQPEMQGGLVKTLDFKIYLGLLSESFNQAHKEDIARVGGVEFDMVVVNLYPFQETVTRAGATIENGRGNIDIGGPCMLRAAAKNFLRVLPLCDPADYDNVLQELNRSDGKISLDTRFNAARKAFAHTAEYDAAIADFLRSRGSQELSGIYDIT